MIEQPLFHWSFIPPPSNWKFMPEWTAAVGANVYIDTKDCILVYTNSMWYAYDPEMKKYKDHNDNWVDVEPYDS